MRRRKRVRNQAKRPPPVRFRRPPSQRYGRFSIALQNRNVPRLGRKFNRQNPHS
jgi:hypothetical protein